VRVIFCVRACARHGRRQRARLQAHHGAPPDRSGAGRQDALPAEGAASIGPTIPGAKVARGNIAQPIAAEAGGCRTIAARRPAIAARRRPNRQ
jgi:hypothetical protein